MGCVGFLIQSRGFPQETLAFFCNECGGEQRRWSGQCPLCLSWNTMVEDSRLISKTAAAGRKKTTHPDSKSRAVLAHSVKTESWRRTTTKLAELDRVMGGGLVESSVTLIGGDPGIGKSTLLTQVSAHFSSHSTALYASGEESTAQISQRAARLNLPLDKLWLLATVSLDEIEELTIVKRAKLLVVDSIQTVMASDLNSACGSVSQLKECCARLTRLAKTHGVTVIIVGHVTKEGAIAGPRVLEHMVDTVLYFEGEQHGRFRALRSIKNRFGAASELGVFAMTGHGLVVVKNPSGIFLADRAINTSGCIVLVSCDGSRPILLEIQALANDTVGNLTRRVAVGVDGQRLNMLLAVLQRHAGVQTVNQDIFINIPGGLKVQETSSDLPLLLAVYSSMEGHALNANMAAFGEIGLTGEVRPVPNGEMRIREAQKQGFDTLILPAANAPKQGPARNIRILAVRSLREAIQKALQCPPSV